MKTAKPEKRNIEERVAETILERKKTVTIDGKDYDIAPPTLATVISISELVALLPPPPNTKSESLDVLRVVLQNAKDSKVIGKIIAVLILGEERVKEKRMVPIHTTGERKKRWWHLRKKRREYIPEVDYLAKRILAKFSPAQANDIVASTLMQLQIPDFFALTTSLTTANQTKPTREVENPTQSGE